MQQKCHRIDKEGVRPAAAQGTLRKIKKSWHQNTTRIDLDKIHFGF